MTTVHQEIIYSRLTDHRKRMWFSPRTAKKVGYITKNGTRRPLYDAGERLPGGVPVLYVRRKKR